VKTSGWALGAVVLCLLLMAVAWQLLRSVEGPQEAAGQEATTPEEGIPTTPSPAAPATTPPANVPSLFPELE
jgi:hypothetical protein